MQFTKTTHSVQQTITRTQQTLRRRLTRPTKRKSRSRRQQTIEQLETRALLSGTGLESDDSRFDQTAMMQPFDVEAGLYQVYSNFGQVGEIDVVSGTFANTADRVGEKINAAGFRSSDRFAYGILTASTELGRIDSGGRLQRLGTIEGLPTNKGTYFVGDFAGDLLYVRNSKEMTRLYGIDIDTRSVANIIETDAPMSAIYDIAFNPADELFYASRRAAQNTLISISLKGQVRTVGENGLQKLTFGGMYGDAEGGLFGVANQTGGVYRFNTETGNATWVAQGPASGTNDGFSNAAQVLELPPTAIDDTFIALSVEGVSANLFADNGSGSDIDGNDDPLTIVSVEGKNQVGQPTLLPSGAQVTVNTDGSFEYESNGIFADLPQGQTATDQFKYQVADDTGLTDEAVATLTMEGIGRSDGFESVRINGMGKYGIRNKDVVLTNVGDVNGDGFDDAMVSATRAFNGAGAAFLINGSANGIDQTMYVDSLFPWNGGDGSQGSVFIGSKVNDKAGVSMTGIGDFNGDGIDDLAISASDADPNGIQNAGTVYVVYGQAGGFDALMDLANLDATTGFAVNGASAHDLIGQTIKGIGDLNGDGLNDLAIAAPNADVNGLRNTGQTFVIFGSENQTSSINVNDLDGQQGFALNGMKAHDHLGTSIDGNADLNGDGLADLLITAPDADAEGLVDSGQSYVVYGRRNQFPKQFEVSSLLKSNGGDGGEGVAINGSTRKSQQGSQVRIVEDLNQDAVNELAICDAVFSLKGFQKPEVRCVSLKPTTVYLDNFDQATPGYDARDWDKYLHSVTLHSTAGTQVTIWGDPHVVITIDGITERFDIGYGAGEIVIDDIVIRWESEPFDANRPDQQLPLKYFSIDAVGSQHDMNVDANDGINFADQVTSLTDSQLRDFAIELRRFAGLATEALRRQ